jgi:hypothetical protein
MKEIGMILAGFIIGGFLGWLSGIAWFELVEVPRAASMDPVTAAMAASDLCAEGRYLPLLMIIPGAFAGMFAGLFAGVLGATAEEEKNQAGDCAENLN